MVLSSYNCYIVVVVHCIYHFFNTACRAAFGAAGQRCMALSVAIFVGESEAWLTDLVDKAKRLQVGPGHIQGVDIGPLISTQGK